MSTVLIVHGAWMSPRTWDRVVPLLEQCGHEVHAPTLTGIGERAHLATKDVGLSTHARDIVQYVTYNELEDIVFVAHSYGGHVLATALEDLKNLARQVVYIDATLPLDGESLAEASPDEFMTTLRAAASELGDGWKIPCPPPLPEMMGLTDPDDVEFFMRRATTFLLRCPEEPASMPTNAIAELPRTFVECTKDCATRHNMTAFAERAKAQRWRMQTLETGHCPMIENPSATVELLQSVTQ